MMNVWSCECERTGMSGESSILEIKQQTVPEVKQPDMFQA